MTWDWYQLLNAVANYYGSGSDQWATISQYGISSTEATSILKQIPGVNIVSNADGSVRSFSFSQITENTAQLPSTVNSNAVTVSGNVVDIPAEMAVETGSTTITATSGLATAGNFVRTTVAPPIIAAGIGITLGKLFDTVLYQSNPDFWDAHDMSTMNPETWNSITSGDASIGASVFNVIFGLDPEYGTAKAYVDQDAVAYVAAYLQRAGAFDTPDYTIPADDTSASVYLNRSVSYNTVPDGFTIKQGGVRGVIHNSGDNPVYAFMFYNTAGTRIYSYYACKNTFTLTRTIGSSTSTLSPYRRVINNLSAYVLPFQESESIQIEISSAIPITDFDVFNTNTNNYRVYINDVEDVSGTKVYDIGWIMCYGNYQPGQSIEGMGTQDGATTPNLDNDDDVSEVLAKLQAQYPDLFRDAVTNHVIQDDGTIKEYVYIPINIPDIVNPTDPHPTSGNQTQGEPERDTENSTESELAIIIDWLSKIPTNEEQDTGEGNTPPVVIPPGSASALYTVYNPTNSEINSFGAWLWSANFVDQILKMFNDPMQAIISLHKVFCSPSISGRNSIKVGYLDSGVVANVVDSQYVTVPCGTVNLLEEFNNVLDYPPFTEVSLYLPFIGIVKLDVNDVMRASISVTYHVDVLTGACLADVNVIRDMYGGVLFQYTGDCSVHYPLSSGSYMGMVTALLGVAGTIVSGGSLAPMMIGATAKAMSGRSSVERSGNLSGNAGAMGSKKPYLIIQRPQPNLANVFETFVGKPANYTTKISNCTGFISCTEVHIENCNGTDAELAELENLLKTGILI